MVRIENVIFEMENGNFPNDVKENIEAKMIGYTSNSTSLCTFPTRRLVVIRGRDTGRKSKQSHGLRVITAAKQYFNLDLIPGQKLCTQCRNHLLSWLAPVVSDAEPCDDNEPPNDDDDFQMSTSAAGCLLTSRDFCCLHVSRFSLSYLCQICLKNTAIPFLKINDVVGQRRHGAATETMMTLML